MTAILTEARQSLWNAIDHWPALDGVFGRQIRMDEEESMLDEFEPLSVDDLPCIAIVPINVTPEWFTHRMQEWPYTLEIRLWTQHWSLPGAESLLEIVGDAIHQAMVPGRSVSIVRAATGHIPKRIGPITLRPDSLQDGVEGQPGTRVVRSTVTIALRLKKDIFGDK